MKPIIIDFSDSSSESLYIQLYEKIRDGILSGEIKEGEKLPSLRSLSKILDVSITTTQTAYNQLLVEGYIISRPQSGYYAAQGLSTGQIPYSPGRQAPLTEQVFKSEENPYICDSECFDFVKWKKCASKVYNEYSDLLLFESNPQGEAALRHEIARYVYSARGVTCKPEQIVIGAGTQQITSHLCRILKRLEADHVSLESPGYLPVQSMFRENGFAISHIPVTREGIDISKLPMNIASAVYVIPSNQFPTGAVMPIGRRRQLLSWAFQNDSFIIEDDYDSELRYFGKPIPALKSLDEEDRVVYLGSFSSTLFPAVKISYMVLPQLLRNIFDEIKDQYTQTCSKAEQLTLALFMEKGYYYTGIRKLRSLYAQKLSLTLQAFASEPAGNISTVDTRSGINLIIKIRTKRQPMNSALKQRPSGWRWFPYLNLLIRIRRLSSSITASCLVDKIESLVKRLVSVWNS